MKEPKRSKQRALKLERFFAKKSVIIILLFLQDVAMYLLGSYLLNVMLHLGDILKNLQNPKPYLGLHNFIPDFQKNREITLKFSIICWFIFLILNLYQIYKFRAAFSEEGFNLQQRGSSRWTTPEEIQKQYTKIPDRNKSFSGYGGTIVSRIGKELYIDQSLTNNLIIGITRSGKGEMFVLPTIDVYSRAEKKTSMIIFDPKTELYKSSKQTLLERGYEVRQLSLVDPVHSMGFNPLSQIVELYKKGIYDDAELLIQSFCYSIFNPDKPTGGDTFWQDSPTSLLAALILAVVEDCVKQNQIDNEYRKKIFDKKCIVYEKMVNGRMCKQPILDQNGKPVVKREYKGTFKPKSIEACRREVVNEIIREKENNLKINSIIRDSIVKQKREHPLAKDKELCSLFFKLYRDMPDCNRNMWNYNNPIMNPQKKQIDAISQKYIEKYHGAEYQEFLSLINAQAEKYKKAYGESSDRNYTEGKLNDLYTRMGNAVLTEIRAFDKQQDIKTAREWLNRVSQQGDGSNLNHKQMRASQVRWGVNLTTTLSNLKKGLKSEWEKTQLEREHDQIVENAIE